MSCVYKVTKKELREARDNIDRSTRGSTKEYYNHILKIYNEMKPLRDRANKVYK